MERAHSWDIPLWDLWAGLACDDSHPSYGKASLCSALISMADWPVAMRKRRHWVHACAHVLQHHLDHPNRAVTVLCLSWMCCLLFACQLPRRDPLIKDPSAPNCCISSKDQLLLIYSWLVVGRHTEGGPGKHAIGGSAFISFYYQKHLWGFVLLLLLFFSCSIMSNSL